ncbi:hypothetical protein [Scytonema sp. PCC 10023]
MHEHPLQLITVSHVERSPCRTGTPRDRLNMISPRHRAITL